MCADGYSVGSSETSTMAIAGSSMCVSSQAGVTSTCGRLCGSEYAVEPGMPPSSSCVPDELLHAALGLAVDPVAERLVELALVAIGDQDALEHEAHVLGGHRPGRALAEGALLAEAAAEVQLEAEHLLVAATGERALQPDVGDLVLGAGVRAAVHVDADRRLEIAHALLEVGDDARRDLLGLADRETAELDAGAGDGLAAERGRLDRRAGSGHLGLGLLDVLVRHVEHEHVLAVGEAHAPVAEVLGDPGEGDHLLARHATAQRGAAERVAPGLALRRDPDVVAHRGERGDRVGGVRQGTAEAQLELGAHAIDAPLVHEELRAGAGALEAVAVVAEDGGQLLGDLDHVVDRSEHAETPSHARGGAESTADPHVIAVAELGIDDADEADVVDLVLRAVMAAGADRDLELARQIGEAAVADEVRRQLVDDRAGVEELVGRHTGERAADHVPPDVTAGLGARQPDPLERVEDLRDVLDAEPVELQALARRDVARRAPEAHGEIADRSQLLGGDGAVRHAHAQHEVAVLLGPLRVQAPPLREREVVGGERVEAAAPRCDEQVVQDVQPVLALLDPLDLGTQVPSPSATVGLPLSR